MSGKSIALLTAGAGTITVSFGGVYLFGENGTGAEGNGKGDSQPAAGTGGEDSASPSQPGSVAGAQPSPAATPGAPEGSTTTGQAQVTAKELKFSSLTEFKDKKGYKCSSLKDVFSDSFNLNDLDSVTELSKSSPDESSYFGDPASDESKIKSCLIINWEKKTYTEQQAQGDGGVTTGDKWSGTFTWTWSFVNDNKGFISVGIATTSERQLDLTGGAYLLEKQNSSDNWTIKYKKEVESGDNKKITDSNFEEKFPKVKTGSGVAVGSEDFWGFASGHKDLENTCAESSSCPKGAQKTNIKTEAEEFEWTFNKSGNKKISEWAANWKWWKVMYGDDGFNLKTRLDNFKGTWSKVQASS